MGRQGSVKSASEMQLKDKGITNAKKYLIENVLSINYTTNYGGQKPVEIVLKDGSKQYFKTYAEAALSVYKSLNETEVPASNPNTRIESKIKRLEKILSEVPENEKEEILNKIEELKASLI
jgi:hypothetical protein